MYEPPCGDHPGGNAEPSTSHSLLLHPDTFLAMATSHFRPYGWFDAIGEMISAVTTAPEIAAQGMGAGVRSLPLPGHEDYSRQFVNNQPSSGLFIIVGVSADETALRDHAPTIASLVPESTCTVVVVQT